MEAAEGSKPNPLDEAVSQNHVTPPSPSGPASVAETCQSEEPEAPLIGNKEEIESGNAVDTELKNPCNDPREIVQSASLVSTGSEDEVTREEKVALEASGSNLESCKNTEEVEEEMGITETVGQDPKTDRELDQEVEEVCAGEPATEITSEEVEQINETDKPESGNVVGAGESVKPVPEIIISMANSEQPEETPAEMPPGGAAESSSFSSSSSAVAKEQDESQQAKTESEAGPASEEETAVASQTPVKQPQQPQGGSASGKKKRKKKKGNKKHKGGAPGDVKQDKDPKPQEENSPSEDPGKNTREENSKGKAAGSCDESIQESPVGAEAEAIAEDRLETDVTKDGASEETENVPCHQTSDNRDDQQEEPSKVTSGDVPTETNTESDVREHPTSDLESRPDMDSVSGGAESLLENKDPLDSSEPTLSEDKDCCDSVTTDDHNDTVAQSTKTDEQGNAKIFVDVSESTVNTDVSESCQDQQVEVDDLPCDTQMNAELPGNPETQSIESKLNVENQTSDGTQTIDCLDSEPSEQKPEGCELLTDSLDAPPQFDGSESTETSQVELTLQSEENIRSQVDAEESLPEVGGNGTKTQPDENEETTDACIQSEETVELMASADSERDPANQDQPAATATSDDSKEDPREGSPERKDPEPETKVEEDEEEDEEGEEFQFEDQDLEALPKTEVEKHGSEEEENEDTEGHQGHDKENNGGQEHGSIEEQNNVEQQEKGEKTSEVLETRLDPTVTGSEEGGAGEEPRAEGVEEREISGVQNNPAKTEQPSSSVESEAEQSSSSTEIEAQTAERGEAVPVGGDSEGASQVADTESGGQEGGPTRKDSKKGKKNKGKGKEDCKMS